MQAFIINRIAHTSPFQRSAKNDLKLDQRRKKLTASELANLSEEERRRYENSNYGDTIEDRLEDFFNKHQDVNHQSGNSQISGVARTRRRLDSSADRQGAGEA